MSGPLPLLREISPPVSASSGGVGGNDGYLTAQQYEELLDGAAGSGALTYATVSSLRAGDVPSNNTSCILLGYYAAGDGGGGQFYYNTASTDDDDGGLVFKPNSVSAAAPGRWLRLYDAGRYNVKWYGAIGDGDNHTLSSVQPTWTLADWQAIYPAATALTNEIDWLAAITATRRTQNYYPDPSGTGRNCFGGEVFFPEGLYYHDQPITPDGVSSIFFFMSWRGIATQGAAGSAYIGGSAWIIYTGDADRYFDLRSAATCNFYDLTIWYNNANFAGKKLFDCTWMPGVNADASHIRWFRCSLAGDPGVFGPGQGAKALISLHLATSCDIQHCIFGQCQASVRFREFPIGAQSYSNKHNVRDTTFLYAQWHLVNFGETIVVDGCTMEGLGGYTEASVTDDGQWTEALPAVTFDIVGGATQTITLIDAAGRTWADYGFVVGMTPFLLDRVNRVNGVNNKDLTPIASFSGGGTVMHFSSSPGLTTQTNTWGRIQASSISAGVPGGYAEATPGIELVFDAAAKTITRNNGSWIDDGWTVGSSEIAIRGTTSNDGVYGPITTLTATVMTIATATFVNETTDVGVVAVTQAQGPFSFTNNWCGDQFLPGSCWINFKNPIGSGLIQGNALVGGTRALILHSGGSFFQIMANTISTAINPFYVTPEGPGWSNATIQNNGAAFPLFDADSQACQQNLNMTCNGEYAQDVIDVILESVTYRSRLTIVAGAVGNFADFTTAAIGITQSSGGSLGFGSDASHTIIEQFGGNGLFFNKLGGGYINLGRLGSYNAVSKTATPHSALDVGGAIATAPVTDNVNHTITERQSFIGMDSTAAVRTATLPDATTCEGREHTIQKIDASANAVNVASVLGQTIDFAASPYVLPNQKSSVTVKAVSGNWVVIAKVA